MISAASALCAFLVVAMSSLYDASVLPSTWASMSSPWTRSTKLSAELLFSSSMTVLIRPIWYDRLATAATRVVSLSARPCAAFIVAASWTCRFLDAASFVFAWS